MSNHSGSYMLNEIVHGLVDMGVLNIMSAAQTKMLRKKEAKEKPGKTSSCV